MKIMIILLALTALTSCRYGTSHSELMDLEEKKNEVVQVSNEGLSQDNHLKLKDYFGSVKDLVYDLKTNARMKNYFHRKFLRYFESDICHKLLLSQKVYEKLESKCSVNGFYLCAEEVKYYKKILGELAVLLTDLEMKNLLKEPKCSELVVDLGIIQD